MQRVGVRCKHRLALGLRKRSNSRPCSELGSSAVIPGVSHQGAGRRSARPGPTASATLSVPSRGHSGCTSAQTTTRSSGGSPSAHHLQSKAQAARIQSSKGSESASPDAGRRPASAHLVARIAQPTVMPKPGSGRGHTLTPKDVVGLICRPHNGVGGSPGPPPAGSRWSATAAPSPSSLFDVFGARYSAGR